ncbi:sn1-specific diacylglycerol lipase [Dendrobium catenatum]|uniref:Sn1-specific diacylglycerol lipase n=1 Tax=Dendrobium catenatum TaxID=906689 RepID=A0A2I0W5E3_9ASPA|nr:sn1-specific diacylglycerol lipase [Dendrobium catenatum]
MPYCMQPFPLSVRLACCLHGTTSSAVVNCEQSCGICRRFRRVIPYGSFQLTAAAEQRFMLERSATLLCCQLISVFTDGRDGEAIPLPRLSQQHQGEEDEKKVGIADSPKDPILQNSRLLKPGYESELLREGSDDDDSTGRKWKVELAWLSKALEPALQLYKWASTAGIGEKPAIPPSTRSLFEILTDLQVSKAGIQEWSLSDLTVGLYLIHLSQASTAKVEDLKGVQINSESMVQELIYHLELAKGCYKDSTSSIARHCMLRERNILKFVKDSSLLRPGYYIGVDTRNKLVILAIRGTHTVYDLITNVVASSDQNVSFDGFSTHFGTAEAARWYLHYEMGTIRRLLEKHKDFRLRLVGHSLGGAAAALLAIMLRRKSAKELGFSPDIISAVGFGTPPCVSKELAESCLSYVSTVVLQDDIIPRLSVASLARLRNEILETDCENFGSIPAFPPFGGNIMELGLSTTLLERVW